MRLLFINIFLIGFIFSCGTDQSDSKQAEKQEEKKIASKIEYTGTPEEIGKQIINHFYEGMNAKDLEKTCQVLHSDVTYMDAVKGFEKVKKHLQKTFDHREKNWLTLKEIKITKATEVEILIYTLESDEGAGFGDNYGFYKLVKENGKFRILIITIPDEEEPEAFKS